MNYGAVLDACKTEGSEAQIKIEVALCLHRLRLTEAWMRKYDRTGVNNCGVLRLAFSDGRHQSVAYISPSGVYLHNREGFICVADTLHPRFGSESGGRG